MALSTVIVQWLGVERAADPAARKVARDRLVTALWVAYRPQLYALARQHLPGQQSDVLASAFGKFVQQLDQGAIPAKTREELFGLLKRRILDKVSERVRKQQRRQGIRPVFAENELVSEGTADGSDATQGVAEWATSREAPPEFQAIINDMLEAVSPGRLRGVLLLIIEDPERSNVDIADELRVSDKEVGRCLKRIRKELGQKWEWFSE